MGRSQQPTIRTTKTPAIPKPQKTHQRRAKNNPVPKEYRVCALCGRTEWCQTHEVYGGSGKRQISIERGYQVPLGMECHRKVTGNEPDTLEKQAEWRASFQIKQFEEWQADGMSYEQAEKEWLRLIGKLYA